MDAEAISARYGTSIVMRRWAATWIDFLIVPGTLLYADWILGNDLYQQTIVIWLAIITLYFPILEGFTGRTVGKLALGIKVVRKDGTVPGFGKAVLRTLLRVVEVNPILFGGLPAGVVALATKTHQRLGDLAARTYVVRVADLQAPGRAPR